MKKENHPPYQQVLFIDSASGHRFVCGSTMQPKASETFEGKEYPVVYLSISSTSHPFFTGSKQLVDSEGRVEKFKKRFDRKKSVAKEGEQKEGSEQKQEDKQKENPEQKEKVSLDKKSTPAAAKKENVKTSAKKKK